MLSRIIFVTGRLIELAQCMPVAQRSRNVGYVDMQLSIKKKYFEHIGGRFWACIGTVYFLGVLILLDKLNIIVFG